jgi:hypothetical protein
MLGGPRAVTARPAGRKGPLISGRDPILGTLIERANVPTGQLPWGEGRRDVVGVRAIAEACPHAREYSAAVDADTAVDHSRGAAVHTGSSHANRRENLLSPRTSPTRRTTGPGLATTWLVCSQPTPLIRAKTTMLSS